MFYVSLIIRICHSCEDRNLKAKPSLSRGRQAILPPPPTNLAKRAAIAAFTLIELSIALVIIGLIIGGILVGQDMIGAAGTRATLAQIEKYNTAVNTFYGKYAALPGDISTVQSLQFGLAVGGGVYRSGDQGRGDGNGVIEGVGGNIFQFGETLFFWEDLSTARLIDGGFNTANNSGVAITATNAALFFPAAKLGGGNYINVYSGGFQAYTYGGTPGDGQNYFSILIPKGIASDGTCVPCNPGLTVLQAYTIDKKIDDGLPTKGKVTAMFPDAQGNPDYTDWAPNAVSPTSATCFDTNSNQYSTSQNNGTGVNCGLSFKMQGPAR